MFLKALLLRALQTACQQGQSGSLGQLLTHLSSLYQCPEALSTQHPRISPNRSRFCVVLCESLRWLPCCQRVRPCVPALMPLHAHLPRPGLPSVVSAGSCFYPTVFLTFSHLLAWPVPPHSKSQLTSQRRSVFFPSHPIQTTPCGHLLLPFHFVPFSLPLPQPYHV